MLAASTHLVAKGSHQDHRCNRQNCMVFRMVGMRGTYDWELSNGGKKVAGRALVTDTTYTRDPTTW